MEKYAIIEGGVCSAKGFRAAGVAAGIKYKDRKDVALIVADRPCTAAAMFTTNTLAAAPVVLDREIAPRGLATWHQPKGGYFVSVNVRPGCAKRTWELCKEAGVVMTDAGATFPYGKDPQDSNIRVAPSLPPLNELEEAMAVFCVCLRLAALEQIIR